MTDDSTDSTTSAGAVWPMLHGLCYPRAPWFLLASVLRHTEFAMGHGHISRSCAPSFRTRPSIPETYARG